MDRAKHIEGWAKEWRACGAEPGDTLLVHSSIARTLRKARANGFPDAGPQDLLDSFLEALGPHGTLLLPLFSFEFTKGVPFDIRTSPSQMGALTECGRKDPRAVRTGHPIYSFAVIGRHAGRFDGLENKSGYGPDSPFALLRSLNGRIGVLDLPDQNSMTFYHHVEEMLEVPYRYHKDFTGRYTDSTGSTTTKTFSIYVRDVERGVVTAVDPMGELLWEKGLYIGARPGEHSGFRTISAEALFQETAQVIRDGRALGLLYSVQRKEASP